MGNETEKLYPASITKLLTSYVVLQYLQPDEIIVAGDALELVPEDSSVANIKEGDKLTVEQLIAAMMLPRWQRWLPVVKLPRMKSWYPVRR